MKSLKYPINLFTSIRMHEVIFTESNTEEKPIDSEWGIEFENNEDKEYFVNLKQQYDEHVRGSKRTVKFQREIRKEMLHYLSEKELDYETAAEIMDWEVHNLWGWNSTNKGKFKRPRIEKEPYVKTEREVELVHRFIKAAEKRIGDPNYNGKTKNLRKFLDPGYTEKKES